MQTDIDPRDLIGHKAVDRNGDKIGTVDEVYLDDATGRPEWAAVRTGIFGRDAFVPLTTSEFSGDELRVPYDKSLVKESPDFGVGQHLSPAQELQLYRYYGLDTPAAGRPNGDDVSHSEQPDLDFGTTAAAAPTTAAAPAKALTFHTPERSPEPAPARTPTAPAPTTADTPRTTPEADMRNLGTPTAATAFPARAPFSAPADAPTTPAASATPAMGPRPQPFSTPADAPTTPATPTMEPKPQPFSTPADAPTTPATPTMEPKPQPFSTPADAPTTPATPTMGRKPQSQPISAPANARAATTATTRAGAAPSSPVEITCREERLEIITEWHTLGTAKLRKYVTTEQVERRVPVVRERVRVERTPVSDAERATLTEKEIAEAVEEVTLREERAVVRKHLTPIERVRLVVERYTTEEVIRDELRREHVEVHDTTAAQTPAPSSPTPPTGSTPPATPPRPAPLRPLV